MSVGTEAGLVTLMYETSKKAIVVPTVTTRKTFKPRGYLKLIAVLMTIVFVLLFSQVIHDCPLFASFSFRAR